MKILVIGCNGQLGSDIVRTFQSLRNEVITSDYPDIDITKKIELFEYVQKIRPQVIINCSAFTSVDLCEQEKEKAYRINATGVENLAYSAKEISAILVHYSTDYVFDGCKQTPYIESDATNPISVYGQSKLLGEQLLSRNYPNYYILRIAWLCGGRGNNFLKKIVQLTKTREGTQETVKVVNDQFGTPTFTEDVCQQTAKLLSDLPQFGIYHSTSEGFCSWFDFATEIVRLYGIQTRVLPCTTKEFPRPAKRPAFSVLENAHLKRYNMNIMPTWQNALEKFVEKYSLDHCLKNL